MDFSNEVKEEGIFSYYESNGEGPTVVLLHGLMGALSNFGDIIKLMGEDYKVVIPILPIFSIPIRKLSVLGLVDYVDEFIRFKEYKEVHVMGNSLGGHIAQLLALKSPDLIKSLCLTGSSGLFESAMGNSFPKRGDYEYIRKKVESVFYSPEIASKELVDEVFEIVNNRLKAIRIVGTAKSAVRHNLSDKLKDIKKPVLLIWGKEDEVTPCWVGEKFHDLLPHSILRIISQCGHAPMMEKPILFVEIYREFIEYIETGEGIDSLSPLETMA